MEIKGTREAFTTLIQERGVYKRLGVSVQTVSTWKIYLREGKNISLDKMEEMLLKAGARVVSEKVWEVEADMRLDLRKLANIIEKQINIHILQFLTGHISVYMQGKDKYEPNALDFNGDQYQIVCTLEQYFPNKLHTSISGGDIEGIFHFDQPSERFNAHSWISTILGAINGNER